jgi:electron transfer flavoprotein alpha subunit
VTKEDYKGMWVFAEQENGAIENTVFELLAKARELKAHNGEEITAVLLGCGVEDLIQPLFAHGAEKVIVADHPALKEYSARPYQQALTQLAEKYRPSIILYGATPLGRDLAPRMMVSLDTGLTADAIDLGYDDDGSFYQTTPAYGGKILAHIVINERRPQMATVHPKMFSPIPADDCASGDIIRAEVKVESDVCYQVLETLPEENAGQSLAAAEVVVAGGRGIKTPEDLQLLSELAGLLGGQLASSRPLVDNGWLTHDRQIGQSGATVKPRLIINVAISGSVQYQLGMNGAACIASVNQSGDAPIFDVSHFGAVSDYRKLIPALISEIKDRKSSTAG